MARSKIDRINDLIKEHVRQAVKSCRLQAFEEGKTDTAMKLNDWEDRIVSRSLVSGTYERLELEDIIKGHKRAWPET